MRNTVTISQRFPTWAAANDARDRLAEGQREPVASTTGPLQVLLEDDDPRAGRTPEAPPALQDLVVEVGRRRLRGRHAPSGGR